MCVYTQTKEYSLVIKKKEIPKFLTKWMNLEDIGQVKYAKQREKDRYYMVSIICGILENNNNKRIPPKNKVVVIETESRMVFAR